MRFPASSCTMITIRSICGTPFNSSITNGDAMLYGKLATTVHDRSPSTSSQSIRIASPSITVAPDGSTTVRRTATMRLSISTAVTTAPASMSAIVRAPSPAPISSTRSPGATSARRAMRRTVFGSTTKF